MENKQVKAKIIERSTMTLLKTEKEVQLCRKVFKSEKINWREEKISKKEEGELRKRDVKNYIKL